MSVTRTCDQCGRGQPEVLRYTLARKEKDADGVKHSVSRGGVDLCHTDWEHICKPRMKSESSGWNYLPAAICDRCQSTDHVLRYTLKKSIRDGQVIRDIAAGGYSLCQECWQAVARPRMRLFHERRQRRSLVERSQRTSGGFNRALRPRQSQG